MIGTDESGKGDYFGPLVCAAVCVDEAGAGTLRSIGVRDSKTCTDGEIRELAEKIRELCAGKFEIIEISPERYNTLYGELSREGKNLNTMLAWGHARAIEELLKKVDCTVAIADQFGDERLHSSGNSRHGAGASGLSRCPGRRRISRLRLHRSWPGTGSWRRWRRWGSGTG